MKAGLLYGLLAAAIPLAAAQESRPGIAETAGDRAELLRLFDRPGHLGVLQVAAAPAALAAAAPLFPRYAGFAGELEFAMPGAFSRIEKVSPAAPPPDIEAPTDLRDALAGVPSAPPGMTQMPPAAVLRTGAPSPLPPTERTAASPAGWLVVTRKAGREIRPLATEADVARWTAAAELQRRAYEAALLERFRSNLERLGK